MLGLRLRESVILEVGDFNLIYKGLFWYMYACVHRGRVREENVQIALSGIRSGDKIAGT
jgi:hypothetical protein